jgi:hypothetical protein
MNRVSRSKAQAGRDKKALKTLVKTGLYKGKIDLRRAPTSYQKRLIKSYSDVIAGKAAVVRPKDPKAYRDLYRVKGDAVIVPRNKGERIGLSKRGRITRAVKTRSGRERRVILPISKPDAQRGLPPRPPTGEAYIYYLPFRRGSGAGQTVQWHRFTYTGLVEFFKRYDIEDEAKEDWLSYVEIEETTAAYERYLEQYITGEITNEAERPLPRSDSRYRYRRRRLRKAIIE